MRPPTPASQRVRQELYRSLAQTVTLPQVAGPSDGLPVITPAQADALAQRLMPVVLDYGNLVADRYRPLRRALVHLAAGLRRAADVVERSA